MLTQYFAPWQLEAAWEIGPQIKFTSEGEKFGWESTIDMPGVGSEDRAVVHMQLYTLYHFMKKGPVIIRPEAALAASLMDTEIRVPVREYRQPFEIMGVVDQDRLVIVWNPPGMLNAWVMDSAGMTYYLKIGPDLPTIEDRIALREGVEDARDYRYLVQGGRLAINACMLAAHRATDLSPLPKQVANHRMAHNRQLRRAALQVPQELRFRDLIIKPRPSYDAMGGFGRLPKQRRSGHWKNAAHGPKFSLHRWVWVNEYETRKDEPWDQPPTTILE